MPVMDDVLLGIVGQIKDEATAAGLIRQRGGIARGVSWAELSGRGSDGSWIEMRLHHRPIEQRLQAGLLRYLPLGRGGRTEILGEHAMTYTTDLPVGADGVVDLVRVWLGSLVKETRHA
jgi:hypothetical protein